MQGGGRTRASLSRYLRSLLTGSPVTWATPTGGLQWCQRTWAQGKWGPPSCMIHLLTANLGPLLSAWEFLHEHLWEWKPKSLNQSKQHASSIIVTGFSPLGSSSCGLILISLLHTLLFLLYALNECLSYWDNICCFCRFPVSLVLSFKAVALPLCSRGWCWTLHVLIESYFSWRDAPTLTPLPVEFLQLLFVRMISCPKITLW